MSQVRSATDHRPDWRDQFTWPIYKTTSARVLDVLCLTLTPLKLSIQSNGVENIPSGPCILASNHIGAIDPLILGLVVYPMQIFFMTKTELFKVPILNWAIRMYGAFPVNRGQLDGWALRHASRVLEAGRMLGLFPEGTRSRGNAKLGKGKRGTVKLALKYKVPVVPAAIMGSQNLNAGLKRTKIKVQIGQSLDFTAMAGAAPGDHDTLDLLTTVLMEHIAALLPPEKRGYYA